LVALELDHTAQLFVLDDSTVASEFLLESLQELLGIILVRCTLVSLHRPGFWFLMKIILPL
jgi:hypothetical protein